MAVNKEVFQLDITGNFDQSLTQLRSEINKSKKAWKELSDTLAARGAGFRSEEEELKNLVGALTGTEQAAYNAKETLVELDSAERTLAKASNNLVRAQNKLNEARAKELTALDQLVKKNDPKIIQARAEVAALRKLTKALEETATQREFERLAAEAGIDLSKKKSKERTAEAIAAERAAKAEKELAIANILSAQGRLPTGKRAPPFTPTQGPPTAEEEEKQLRLQVLNEKAKKQRDDRLDALRREAGLLVDRERQTAAVGRTLGQVADAAEHAESRFSRLLFTFRRLVGVMAAFTVARVVVGGFRDMIAGAVRFNAAIETNRVGLTGLIAAAGDIRDAEGKRVPLAQQLNLAQDISIDQMNKLRTAALQTAASYEELSTAFTQAVAPGISAGLTLDQIRKVTADISQAASGLGVAQNQLSEEIRSLFQGTINPRNTRVATALGITSADIARAKEVGNLFQFLQTRFAAISATGQRLMNTFTGQLSNAADAFSQLLATTSQPLFEQLKSGLQEIQKGIFDTINDNSAFNPQALKAFQGLFDGLAAGVAGIRKAFQDINVQGFADSFGLIGQALGFAASALSRAFVIFFDVAAPAVTAAKALFAAFSGVLLLLRGLNDVTSGWLGSVVTANVKVILLYVTLAKIVGAAKAFYGWFIRAQVTIKAMTVGVKTLDLATGTVITSVTSLRKGLLTTLLPVLALVSAFTLLSKLLPKGFKNTLFDGIASGLNSLTSSLDDIVNRMVTLPEEAKKATGGALGIVGDNLRGISDDLAEIQRDLKETSKEIATDRRINTRTLGISPELASQVSILEKASLLAGQKLLEVKRKEESTAAVVAGLTQEGLIAGREQLSAKVKYVAALDREMTLLEAAQASARDRAKKEVGIVELSPEESVLGGRQKDFFLKQTLAAQRAAQAGAAVEREISAAQAERTAAIKESEAVEVRMLRIASEIKVANEQIATAKKLQQEESDRIVSQEIERVSILAETNVFEKELARQKNNSDTQLELESLQAILAGDEKALALAKAQASVRDAGIAKRALEARFSREVLTAQLLIEAAENSKSKAVQEGLGVLKEQKQLITDTYDVELKIAEAKKQAAVEQERLDRLRQNGTASEGVAEGIKQLQAARKSTATIMQDLVISFADGLASALAQSVTTAISTALHGGDVGAAIAQIGEQLALSVLSGLLTDLFKNAISSLFSGAAASAPLVGAATTAGATLAAGGVKAGTGMSVGASAAFKVLSSATAAMTTAIGAAATTALEAIAAAKLATAGGGVVHKARGGKILPFGIPDTNRTGFARGGSTTRRSRPLGRDPRDTIPAMLRPGEWVIRPESVGKYGDRFMSLLNRGKINPALLRGLVGGSSSPAPTPKRSFATGGPVVAAAASAQGSPQNVLLFHDEQTMDRSLAAGPDSMLRFVRTHRASYRAALGV